MAWFKFNPKERESISYEIDDFTLIDIALGRGSLSQDYVIKNIKTYLEFISASFWMQLKYHCNTLRILKYFEV